MVYKLKGKLVFFLLLFFTGAVAQNTSRPINNQLAEETNALKNSKGNCSLSINKTISMDIQLLNDLIKNRRSVFPDQFVAGKKAEDTIIEQILEAFAAFQSNLYKQEPGTAFTEGKYLKMQQQPLKASHIIAIGMKRSAKKGIPEIEDIEALSCAVQNIYLSFTACGLGGYWTTGGITYLENAKPFFGLNREDKLLGFFYIGHVAVPSPDGKKLPLKEKTTWVSTA